MYNLDDKDLDRISRNAAENYKVPGEPSWDALQKTLDIELPVEKEKKRRGFILFFLLAGLLVTGSLIWYGQHNIRTSTSLKDKANQLTVTDNKIIDSNSLSARNQKQENSRKHQSDVEKTLPGNAVASQKKPSSPKSLSETLPLPEKTSASSVKNNTLLNKNNYHPEKNFNNPGSVRKQPKNIADVAAGGQHGFILSADNKTAIAKKNKNRNTITDRNLNDKLNNNNNKKDIAAKSNLVNDDDNNINPDNISSDKDSATGKVAANNNKVVAPPVVSKIITTDSAASPKKETAKVAAKKNKVNKRDRAINIGLAAGLDLSTVKYTHSADPGFNLGLLGGYQFNKNWSVYTGVIYTKKNYNLDGKDYHPPVHYWTTYVDLQAVDGYCRMWEVPLLARYTFDSKTNKHFFISTGLSSYFMKKQQYNYSYKIINTGNYANSAWTNDSSYNHIFSILHFSAGFEKQMGKHLNWQIEPYAKIPLGGVGFGNIKLSSFGINFSIQYRHAVK